MLVILTQKLVILTQTAEILFRMLVILTQTLTQTQMLVILTQAADSRETTIQDIIQKNKKIQDFCLSCGAPETEVDNPLFVHGDVSWTLETYRRLVNQGPTVVHQQQCF